MRDPHELILHDNGAETSIEDAFDPSLPVDVPENPFGPDMIDDDGYPDNINPGGQAFHEFHDEEPDLAYVSPEENAGLDDQRSTGEPDDFDEHVSNIVEGEVLSGGEDMAGYAHAEHKAEQEDKTRAPSVLITPESARRALLGGNKTMSIDATGKVTDPVEVARWTCDIDAEACPVTINLGMVSQVIQNFGGETFIGPVFRPYAIVQFGVRSSNFVFEVDIKAGVQFTIGASAVNVQVALEPVDPLITPTAAGSLELGAQLSFFASGHVRPVTRTLHIPATAAVVTNPIPKYSESVSVWRNIPSDAVSLVFYDSKGNGLYQVDLPPTPTFMFQPVPISGGAYFVGVFGTAGPINSTELIFNLAV